MKEVSVIPLFMSFLVTWAVVPSTFLNGIAYGEFVSQTPPPVGFGSYLVGWMDMDIPKTGAETLPIRVHYPARTPGLGAELNTTQAPNSTLLFSPGFGTTITDYSIFAHTLASWGFVCVLVGSEPESLDVERKNDLIHTLDWLDEQSDNSSFKLSQVVGRSKFGVLGHSLGGAAAIAASASDPRFKVSIPIAPSLVNPASAASIHVPLLILAGSDDVVTPPSTMSYPVYAKGKPLKFFLTLQGVNHQTIVFAGLKYILSFLKLYLCEEEGYAIHLYGTAAQQEIEDRKIELMYDLRTITQYNVLHNSDQHTVFVYSDSTLLNLVYSQTMNQMNLTIDGPPDTKGTANITIPEPLVPDTHSLKVYFDEEPYPFVATRNSSSYFIFLTYNHSQHQITISLAAQTPSSSLWMEWWVWAIICSVVLPLIALTAVAALRNRKKNMSPLQNPSSSQRA